MYCLTGSLALLVVCVCSQGPHARGALIRNNGQRKHVPVEDMEVSAAQNRPVYVDALMQPYLYALAGLPVESHNSYSDDMQDSVVEGSEPVHQKTLAKPVAFSYYKNDEVPDLAAAASDKAGGQPKSHSLHHHEKGGGKKHYSEHHGAHGEKGKKGYKGYHEHDKGSKGHHDKEMHSGHYSDKGGHKKKHHHEDAYHGHHHKADKGQKGAKYEEHGKHSKGHSTKGGHNVHKNDVFEKKTVFYDEHHEGGESEKHGGFHTEKKHKKGSKKKSGKKRGGHHESHHGKKGHYAKGGHHHEKKGHKKEGGQHHHHTHKEKYGKKDGKEHHTKWGFKKGKSKKANLEVPQDGAEQQVLLVVKGKDPKNQDLYVNSPNSPNTYRVDPNGASIIQEVSPSDAKKQTEASVPDVTVHRQLYVKDGDKVFVANVQNIPPELQLPTYDNDRNERRSRGDTENSRYSRMSDDEDERPYIPRKRGDPYEEARAKYDGIDRQEEIGNIPHEQIFDEAASEASAITEVKKIAPPRKRFLIAVEQDDPQQEAQPEST